MIEIEVHGTVPGMSMSYMIAYERSMKRLARFTSSADELMEALILGYGTGEPDSDSDDYDDADRVNDGTLYRTPFMMGEDREPSDTEISIMANAIWSALSTASEVPIIMSGEWHDDPYDADNSDDNELERSIVTGASRSALHSYREHVVQMLALSTVDRPWISIDGYSRRNPDDGGDCDIGINQLGATPFMLGVTAEPSAIEQDIIARPIFTTMMMATSHDDMRAYGKRRDDWGDPDSTRISKQAREQYLDAARMALHAYRERIVQHRDASLIDRQYLTVNGVGSKQSL